MKHLTEKQTITINKILEVISLDESLLETIAKEIGMEYTELEDFVHNVEL